ncbi:hypothetical protein NDU88_000301 [Pleurodeles waltl]|uniref:Lamina-associated polypeptide 2 alpha C-terminal domain-containing protein n=1 Tax=Pleurodeles waltl TaxID=8319 RepID=A0AAV7PZU1_PLEWA|nr:hypothetical protein NDU88_000301 [Pleurodeles waltl]
MPSSLIQDLQSMLQDYRRRFPAEDQPPAPVSPVTPINAPPPPATPRLTSHSVLAAPPRDEGSTSGEEEQEEGEISTPQHPTEEWDDYLAPTPSPPPPRPSDSPPEDIGGFHNLMDRAAVCFHLPTSVSQSECFLHDFKEQSRKSVRSIPIIDFIWSEGTKIMRNPATVPPVPQKLDKKYKATQDSPACLTGHPKPDSVISQAAQRRSKNPSTPISTPPDKEGRRLDNIGKRFSSMSAITVRAANSLAILGRYDRQMWSDMQPFLDLIPENKQAEARKILQEGERTSEEIIDCALDIASTGFRQLAGAAVLRRQGWLKATSFRPEVQSRILDMPYDGESLFGKHVDDALQAIKTDTDTAKSLGTLQYRKQPFRGARGRGFTSFQGSFNRQYQQSQYRPSYHQQYRQSSTASYTRQGGKRRQGSQSRDQPRKQ